MSCTPVKLPAVEADFCAPNINWSQVDNVYLGNLENPFTDWSSLTEWTSRIDNTDAGISDTAIKHLHVIGDKPRPERNSVAFSKGRTAHTTPNHTVNLIVDETGDNNYNLIKWLEDNAGQKVALWYSAGKYIYGGNEGIEATIVLDDVIAQSDEELNVFQGEAVWEGNHPERILNPMA